MKDVARCLKVKLLILFRFIIGSGERPLLFLYLYAQMGLADNVFIREIGMSFGIPHDAAWFIAMVVFEVGMSELMCHHFPEVPLLALQPKVGSHTSIGVGRESQSKDSPVGMSLVRNGYVLVSQAYHHLVLIALAGEGVYYCICPVSGLVEEGIIQPLVRKHLKFKCSIKERVEPFCKFCLKHLRFLASIVVVRLQIHLYIGSGTLVILFCLRAACYRQGQQQIINFLHFFCKVSYFSANKRVISVSNCRYSSNLTYSLSYQWGQIQLSFP